MKLLTRDVSDYRRITNNIFYLNSSYRLIFVVDIKYADKNKNFRSYATEFITSNGSYIYLDLKYHLAIESTERDDITNTKNQFLINNNNNYQFNIALDNAAQWITNKAYTNIFAKMGDGSIKYIGNVEPIKISDIYKDILEISPATYNTDNKNESGISIYINDSDPIFLNSLAFMNFKYFIDNFNMHSMAMQMVTWLGHSNSGDSSMPASNSTSFTSNTNFKNNDGFLSRVKAKERNEEND